MSRVLDWIQGFAVALGGPGLFVIAFFDSSFLSFPEVCDILVVLLTVRHPERMPYYALMTTMGSICGCYALYHLAKRGGEAFLRKRLSERHVDKAMALFRRHGVLAIIVPSLLPPPMPFKMFVLAAGVTGVPRRDFLLAVGFGRSARYFGEGLLALWYGEAAIAFLHENARTIALIAGITVLTGGLFWIWWKQRKGTREV